MARRMYEAPDGKAVLVVPVDVDGIVFDVEVVDREGEVVDFFQSLNASGVVALAVQRGWRPCRAR